MKHARLWKNGILVKESLNGIEVIDNYGKTAEQLGGKLNFQSRISKQPIMSWPIWAKALRFLAKPQDKGIGDVIARMIGDEKSDAFKKWYKQTFGKDCGCVGRQARWNRMYPL